MKGIPCLPTSADAQQWLRRLSSILISDVVNASEWENLQQMVKEHHPVLSVAANLTIEEVRDDLGRRGLAYSDSWWHLSSSIDWELAR